MYLARMDYRKMRPTTKQVEEGIEIQWNPEIDKELMENSEKIVNESHESLKYSPLQIWSHYKIRNSGDYKIYKQYEDHPKVALKEVKELISNLKKPEKDNGFLLINYGIPGAVCSVLVRDYSEELSKKDLEFCKNIILDNAVLSFNKGYQYQISDGAEFCIGVLPELLKIFLEDRIDILTILLLTLFDDHPIGMGGGKFNNYSINAIHKLWEDNFIDAQSLIFGYIRFKKKYEDNIRILREGNYKKNIYELDNGQVVKRFLKSNESSLEKVLDSKTVGGDLTYLDGMDLSSLGVVLRVLPLRIENKNHKIIIKKVIEEFVEGLVINADDDRIDYMVKHNFLVKLSYLLLEIDKNEVKNYLKPFLENYNNSEVFADFFERLVMAQDILDKHDNFWNIWNIFREYIIDGCKDGKRYWDVKKIIKSYLFATVKWKTTKTNWHSFKDEEKVFFSDISKELGSYPSTIYSISKLLNDIGIGYVDDGIYWLSDIVSNNQNLVTEELETNTIYYIENYMRRYIHKNREKVRKDKRIKKNVLTVLDFLIQKRSIIAYILRESIL